MPLAKRIIPCVLTRGRQMVKGTAFNSWRSVGLTEQAMRIHGARGVDELVLLDISATAEGRGPDLKLVEQLSRDLFCPLAVGGGVRTVDDVKALLRAGADKAVIGTGGQLAISNASAAVGSQAIVAALDVRDGYATVRCGTVTTMQPAIAWARSCADHGAGEILLTSIERDGTMNGYDLDLIRDVSSAVSIPVIANGGCGSYEDMRLAIEAGASAVAAGAMFLFSDLTPKGAAEYLLQHNIEVRIPA